MELLDPSHEQRAAGGEPAPRLPTLAGTTVGVISNGKENTKPFFDLLTEALQRDHGVATVVRRVKSNYSAPAEADLMAEAMGWDAVLSGVGD